MAFRSELEFCVNCSVSQNNQSTYFTGSRLFLKEELKKQLVWKGQPGHLSKQGALFHDPPSLLR